MQPHRILLSNLGYARGISGRLVHHLFYVHRHFYCSPEIQKKCLKQLMEIIEHEDPDICCFVEIDKGSLSTGMYNQFEGLMNEKYAFFDIENKYGKASPLRRFFMTSGKSNAFTAKRKVEYEKIYFSYGAKRLAYKIRLEEGLTLFFAHFSLQRAVRARQLAEAHDWMKTEKGEVIFLGDFNILEGVGELDPVLRDEEFVLLNDDEPTFFFHTRELTLDLCIASRGIARSIDVKIIPQPYSDHAALVVDIVPKTAD